MLLELRRLTHTYMRGTPFVQEALRGVSLSIEAGQTVGLVGPTKSGKSTVVDFLNGLIAPPPGALFYRGQDVAAPGYDRALLRRRVGVVFQAPEAQLFEDTVGKDVSFALRMQKLPLAESRRRVQSSLEAVGLDYEEFRLRYIHALSGGQKRRVAIAGVLAMQPEVLVLDEPTSGLDPRGRQELLELITTLRRQMAITIVYVSGGLTEIVTLADQVYVLNQGQVALSGPPRDLLSHMDQLSALDIALPEASRIAFALRQRFPTIRTDLCTLDELEAELLRVSPTSPTPLPEQGMQEVSYD